MVDMEMPENISGMQPPSGGMQTSARGLMASDAAQPEPEDGPAPGQPVASPEEQRTYEEFVSNALLVLWSEQGAEQRAKALMGKDPRAGVASVTSQIVMQVVEAAARQRRKIPAEILMAGLSEIVSEVIEFGEDAGATGLSDDPKMVQGAYFRAVDQTREMLQDRGLIDEAEMEQDFAQMLDADEGQLQKALMNPETAAQMEAAEGGAPTTQETSLGQGEDGEAPVDEEQGLTRAQRRRRARRQKKRARQGGME